MTPQEIDRIENAIRHIQTAADVDPWAVEIAVGAMKKQREALNVAISALHAQEAKTQLSAEGTTSDLISRQAAIDRINKQREHLQPDIYPQDKIGDAAYRICAEFIERLPSAQPEWNNHTVACMLAELFDDTCACNYNGIDEWLPEKCELLDSCPNPAGVACWEQFLKHRAERRTDEGD